MICTVTEMYRKLRDANITILRVGLKSTDLINETSSLVLNDYHPAFRELIEGSLALEQMERLLRLELNSNEELLKYMLRSEKDSSNKNPIITFLAPSDSMSSLSGHKKENRIHLNKKYPLISFRFKGDDSLKSGEIGIEISVP
jgi:hypothetical protein